MIKERKILTIEYTAIILLWTLVAIFPILFMDDNNQDWVAVHVIWAECAIMGVAFLINRFILMSSLFFKQYYIKYFIALALLFLLLALFIIPYDGVNIILSLFGEGLDNVPHIHPEIGGTPPHGMPPHAGMPPHGMSPTPSSIPFTNFTIPPMYTTLILSAIVIALDIGLSIAVKWIISEQKQADINRERVSAQLTNLQSQVSPHFFMNTLNNIHALVDIDSQRAKQTIIELSNLMRYLLYESSTREMVSLQKEIEFINSYINLMRLRFSKQVKIEFSYGDNIPSIKIPPFLFLNFIENAFKYGVDLDQESYIKIKFTFGSDHIKMTTINSNHADNAKGSRDGLGISNSRKRLELLYDDRYSLEINDIENIFYVYLQIPII